MLPHQHLRFLYLILYCSFLFFSSVTSSSTLKRSPFFHHLLVLFIRRLVSGQSIDYGANLSSYESHENCKRCFVTKCALSRSCCLDFTGRLREQEHFPSGYSRWAVSFLSVRKEPTTATFLLVFFQSSNTISWPVLLLPTIRSIGRKCAVINFPANQPTPTSRRHSWRERKSVKISASSCYSRVFLVRPGRPVVFLFIKYDGAPTWYSYRRASNPAQGFDTNRRRRQTQGGNINPPIFSPSS